MNIQQLEYILAIDKHRHFVKAAESCFVTQATLSMMIRKLEEELGVVIFDRSRQPVIPTEPGKMILAQARNIIRETRKLHEMASGIKNEIAGELRIGIIPTLAPYLLPLFLREMLRKYPQLQLHVSEITTPEICKRLEKDELDIGILATPLNRKDLNEYHLFNERLLTYVASDKKLLRKKYLLPGEIDPKQLWLLEEGHCLRTQMLRLCELRQSSDHQNLHYEAGSIESVMRMAELGDGITIIPELATIDMPLKKKNKLREFRAPQPVREISLVTYRHFVRGQVLEKLAACIRESVEKVLPKSARQAEIIPAE